MLSIAVYDFTLFHLHIFLAIHARVNDLPFRDIFYKEMHNVHCVRYALRYKNEVNGVEHR